MAENNDSNVSERPNRGLPSWLWWALALIVVFLLGFVPMWLQYREANNANEMIRKDLRRADVSRQLLTSIVEARAGEYEQARQNASDFFTNLDAEIKRGDEGNLKAGERENLKAVFTNRDNIITMLAQRDPAASERLMDIYQIYKGTIDTAKPAVPTP